MYISCTSHDLGRADARALTSQPRPQRLPQATSSCSRKTNRHSKDIHFHLFQHSYLTIKTRISHWWIENPFLGHKISLITDPKNSTLSPVHKWCFTIRCLQQNSIQRLSSCLLIWCIFMQCSEVPKAKIIKCKVML